MNSLLYQTKALAASYIIFVIADFIMMPVGNSLFEHEKDFMCYDKVIVEVMNNAGALYLLVYTILLFGYSFMIWFVFYRIPSLFGLISKARYQRVDIINRMTEQIHDDNILLENIMNVSETEDYTSHHSPSPRSNTMIPHKSGMKVEKNYRSLS